MHLLMKSDTQNYSIKADLSIYFPHIILNHRLYTHSGSPHNAVNICLVLHNYDKGFVKALNYVRKLQLFVWICEILLNKCCHFSIAIWDIEAIVIMRSMFQCSGSYNDSRRVSALHKSFHFFYFTQSLKAAYNYHEEWPFVSKGCTISSSFQSL